VQSQNLHLIRLATLGTFSFSALKAAASGGCAMHTRLRAGVKEKALILCKLERPLRL